MASVGCTEKKGPTRPGLPYDDNGHRIYIIALSRVERSNTRLTLPASSRIALILKEMLFNSCGGILCNQHIGLYFTANTLIVVVDSKASVGMKLITRNIIPKAFQSHIYD